MTPVFSDILAEFSTTDAVAVAWLFLCFATLSRVVGQKSGKRASTETLMSRYRELWMEQMITRQPRIFDASILATLRQGTAFFASGCMIAIGGAAALLGQPDRLQSIAGNIDQSLKASPLVWEAKLFTVVFFLVIGFLRFVWAHRVFGYCGIVMAAVPNEPEDPTCQTMSRRAAKLANTASRSFNSGLRAIYFALASLGWFVSPWVLFATTLLTVFVLLRREFASQTRAALLEE